MKKIKKSDKSKGFIKHAGKERKENITQVIESNYMPYAMSVIMSRAIPEIDGFKPSQRKLLYTMYKMGLLESARTKSANIVGQTMKLNPHGDSAIYDTMARMSRGYGALPHPYVDSKGNFGKFYSRDMTKAASRYTEAKLEGICKEIFKDIDKDTVDFVPNYDSTMLEPTLLPTAYPSVLVNSISGIAVGMASSICPFNLKELCETTIKLMNNPNYDILSSLIAPDFPGGAEIIYDKDKIDKIYKTGRGGISLRGRYTYDSKSNCVDITHIPPTTTGEVIIEKIVDLIKQNKITEISDIRDETGLDGFKITIDLKRGADVDRLVSKLFKFTPMQDNFNCNFNILIKNKPKVMSVREIIFEWINFRVECIKRRIKFDLDKKKKRLHLLSALEKILLDIDKAIKIIRETPEESLVVENLMIGFKIDEEQAEFIAEIKLRNLNKEYIIKKVDEIKNLKDDIKKLEFTLKDEDEIKKIISSELREISKKYGKKRVCPIVNKDDIEEQEFEEEIPDYPVTIFFTKEGYLKKITAQSLRMSGEQKLKNGDEITQEIETNNNCDLIFFTSLGNAYKASANTFRDSKASVMGDFVCAHFGGEENEKFLYVAATKNYSGFMMFFFEDGKVSKINMKCYQTKLNRKKLVNSYSDKSPVVAMFYIVKEQNFSIKSTSGKVLTFNSSVLVPKETKNSQGVIVMKQGKHKVCEVSICDSKVDKKYFVSKIPSSGKYISAKTQQLKF